MPFEDGDARDIKTFKSRSEKRGKLAMPDFEDGDARDVKTIKSKSKKRQACDAGF
jgi:hypothetical protein